MTTITYSHIAEAMRFLAKASYRPCHIYINYPALHSVGLSLDMPDDTFYVPAEMYGLPLFIGVPYPFWAKGIEAVVTNTNWSAAVMIRYDGLLIRSDGQEKVING